MSLDFPAPDNIFLAHCVKGIPSSEIMIPYPSIRSLLDSQVRRYGDKPFLIFYDSNNQRNELSYNRFFANVSRTANFLVSEGVSFGDRIAIRTENDPETLTQYFGTWMIGAVAVPIKTKDENQTDSNLEQTGALPVFPEKRGTFLNLLTEYDDEYQIGKKSKLDDDVLIIGKYDNKGEWKGIVLSHYNMLVDAMATADWHRLSDDLPIVSGAPLYDVASMVGCIMSALYAGASIVLTDLSDVELLLRRISSEKAQVTLVDNQMIEKLFEYEIDVDQFDFSSFRHFISPHRHLTSKMVIETKTRWGLRIIPGFCKPETASFASFIPIDLTDNNFTNWFSKEDGLPVGMPLHPNEVGILDTEGKMVSEGERGEIAIRGHNVMQRYLDDEEATNEVFRSGWLRTGEKGFYRLDEDGKMRFIVTSKPSSHLNRVGL